MAIAGKIQTVLGAISPEELGYIDIHDHIARKEGKEVDMGSTFLLQDVDKALKELDMFHKVKGTCVVDAQPISGRDIEMLVKIAQKSPVHIIASTGFHVSSNYFNNFWGRYCDIDEMVHYVVEEVTEGIEINNYEAPMIKRSSAKAGVAKCSTSYQVIKPEEERWIRTVAKAHKKTGIPIITHTDVGTMALELIEILTSEGVDPRNVVIGHIDRNPDLLYHMEVAKTGAVLEYDGPSRTKYHPDNVISNLIFKMCEKGYEDQIVLSGDMGKRVYHKTYNGGPGLEYNLKTFVPRLRKEGLDEKIIEKILVDTPRRMLTFKEV